MRQHTWAAAEADAFPPRKIGQRRNLGQAAGAQRFTHQGALCEAMFEEQPATGVQVGWRACGDRAERSHALGPGAQRGLRLKAQVTLRKMAVVIGNVGRIADDGVKVLALQRREPIAAHQAQQGLRAQTPGIALRHRQRGGRALDRRELPGRAFARQCEGNRTTARAKIEY